MIFGGLERSFECVSCKAQVRERTPGSGLPFLAVVLLVLLSCGGKKHMAPLWAEYEPTVDAARCHAAEIEKVYCDLFGLENGKHSGKMKIDLLESKEDMAEKIRRETGIEDADHVGGLYQPDDGTIVLISSPSEWAFLEGVRHETVHCLNHRYFGRIDSWLDEGLAVFFEAFVSADGFERRNFRYFLEEGGDLLKDKLDVDRFPPMAEFLIIKTPLDFQYIHGPAARKNYGICLALMAYLYDRCGNDLFASIRKYIEYRKDLGKPYAGSKQAFKRAFKVALYRLDEDLREFYREKWD